MFVGSSDSSLSLTVMIACPVIYMVWLLFVRKDVPKLIEEADKLPEVP